MIRLVTALGVGYVLGSKAGRRRYEQINRAYRAVSQSPATKKAIDVGRQKLSERLSTEPRMTEIKQIDDTTSVYAPEPDRR
ncbi:hypothetical protein [Williamsia sterculiae]|uniref:Oxygen-dependent protoporphyrinogen oxidase n=1 Tax=Williamsia sterculiae TaxID=1344003 RepID=A0A1N7G7U4_9NOCA|nr:hypothetical protein [Williamsia sterculiae]SIS08618.1 hypothetical protein SAMN05445060_2575 [Williamsia sterculiae]